MALIYCPNCGKQISDKAEKCVHCGVSLHQTLKEDDQPIVWNAYRPPKKKPTVPTTAKVIILGGFLIFFIYLIYGDEIDNFFQNGSSKNHTEKIINDKNTNQTQKEATKKTKEWTIPEILSFYEMTESFDQISGAETISIYLKMNKDGTFKYNLLVKSNVNPYGTEDDVLYATGKYSFSGSLSYGVQIKFEGKTGDGKYFSLLGKLTKEEENKYYFSNYSGVSGRIGANNPKLPWYAIYTYTK